MSLTKRLLEEEEARGWKSSGDVYVCADCFVDDALRQFTSDHVEAEACDFCGARQDGWPVAAPLDLVVELIAESINTEWANVDDVGVPYESREGGYIGTVYDTWELFWEIDPPFENGALWDAINNALPVQLWCVRSFWELSRDEALTASWQEFKKLVMYRTRYLFLTADVDDSRDWELVAPKDMLDAIAATIDEAGLMRVLPAGSAWWRARDHAPQDPPRPTAAELGTAPVKAARSNRMSPAGIPMFYGAAEQETAVEEVGGVSEDRHVTVGMFELARPAWVLDLTDLPEIPSLFDRARRHLRPTLRFLRSFAQDVSKPVEGNDREHLEYVPTQIVTEYLRHVYRIPEGQRVIGMLYKSSRPGGGTCCVLFVEAAGCVDQAPGWQTEDSNWLGLRPASVTTVRH